MAIETRLPTAWLLSSDRRGRERISNPRGFGSGHDGYVNAAFCGSIDLGQAQRELPQSLAIRIKFVGKFVLVDSISLEQE